MKKKLLALFLTVVMVLAAVVGLVACDPKDPDNPDNPDNPTPGAKTNITVWVSEVAGVKTLTDTQVAAFLDANPEYKEKYTVTVEGVGEGEAATNMITDVASGADIYCFAQDQLGRLVEANALAQLGVKAGETVTANNDTAGIAAVTLDGKMYAYPLTSDNGYFLYYDKRVLSADDVKDLGTIVAKAKAAGKKVSFQLGGSAWYMASFFFGAGCNSSWTYDNAKKLWKANDNFNSDKGLIAMRGMHILTGETDVWEDSQDTSDFGAATPSCAVVSGVWDLDNAKKALGENLATTKLPTYNVGGKDYQLTSFAGNKLIGVKPQTDATVGAFCHALAQYLSNKQSQLDRFDEFGWGPSNLEAQKEERVASDPTLSALAEQNKTSVVQGQICGGWWDFAKLLGTESAKAEKYTDKDNKEHNAYQEALDSYQAQIDRYESMTPEEMAAFGIIGSIASLEADADANAANTAQGTKWAKWSTDLKMVEGPDNTYKSVVAVVLAAGDAFQCRQGQAWTVQFGKVVDGVSTKSDFTIDAATAGTYYIQLVVEKDKDGKITKGVVSLVPAQ